MMEEEKTIFRFQVDGQPEQLFNNMGELWTYAWSYMKSIQAAGKMVPMFSVVELVAKEAP